MDRVLARLIGDPGGAGRLKKIVGDPERGRVKKLDGVAACKNLVTLKLSQHQISDLGPLAELAKLRDLDLSSNAITDLGPLSGVASLRDLRLYYNRKLADITPLRSLVGLEVLYLSETSVVDIAPLAELRALRYLSLGGTPVVDVSPLAVLPALTNVVLRDCTALALEDGNPSYRAITALVDRGVDVTIAHPLIDAYRARA